ncbi:MAG: hypothetical protein N3B21_07020 [Clostridia bacterium]|nr:hypothetical protein [Clostridia bacterium]
MSKFIGILIETSFIERIIGDVYAVNISCFSAGSVSFAQLASVVLFFFNLLSQYLKKMSQSPWKLKWRS